MTSSNINFIENNYGVNHINTILEHFYVFSLGSNINLLPAIQSIDSLSFVKECGLDVIGESHAVPNDPEYLIKQWGLKSNLYGTGVDSAWTITTGDSNIVVAVIDNGVDFYHPDLGMGTDGYENIYKNPGEDPWAGPIDPITGNGIDDDGNGYIDDWKGWNFYSNSPIGTKNSNYYFGGANAVNNHGTSCAGIIAAKSNNSKGVSGIAGGWGANGVKILPINTGPYPFNSTFPKVMDYLIKMKVDIISVSSGGGSPYNTNPVLDSLLELAYKSNISIVFSSGNEANNSLPWAPDVQFPANSKYTLGVGAYDYNGIRKNYSNYGPLLDIAAPTDFYTISTVYGPYDYFGGTSAAAPHVAGIIALMKSINKCLSTSEVYEIIKKTADTSGLYNHYWNNSKPKHSKEFGYGRINAFEAVKMAQSTKSNTLDLYIKDDENDFGLEPNDNSNHFYLSSDIWTRNSNDGTANAYLMVIENGIIRNYMVTNTASKIIQTSNFSNGTHTILLICDGVIKDSKQFVKI